MRKAIICLAGIALIAACSKAPTDAGKSEAAAAAASGTAASAPTTPAAPTAAVTGPPVSGTYTANGKPAALTQVTAHTDEPFDGKPVIELVFTAKDQTGDPKAGFNALFGKLGDAITVKVQPDGTVIGANIVHAGLKREGSIAISGPITMQDYHSEGGQISGHLTSGGPIDVFDEKVAIDLTFHTKAP